MCPCSQNCSKKSGRKLPEDELRQLYRAAYEQYQSEILNGRKAYSRYVNDFFSYHLPPAGLDEADMRLHVMHVYAVRELLEERRDLVDKFFSRDMLGEDDFRVMDDLFNSGKTPDEKPVILARFSDNQMAGLMGFINAKDMFVSDLSIEDIRSLFACRLTRPLQASNNRNVAIFFGWLRYYGHLPHSWQMIMEDCRLVSSSRSNEPLTASQLRSCLSQGKNRKMERVMDRKAEDAGFDYACKDFVKSLAGSTQNTGNDIK